MLDIKLCNKFQINISKVLRVIIIAMLAVLLFYPPYVRGLYFTKELLVFHIISFSLGIAFLIYMYITKDCVIFKTSIDYAAAGLVACYFLPIMFSQAASLRASIAELLKVFNYFILYLIIRDIINSRKQLIILLNVIITSTLGIALIGIDSAAGEKAARVIESIVNLIPGINYKIFGGYVDNRIASMIQYPNTLASYLLAMFILLSGLIIYTKNKALKCMYTGISFILLITFIFTYSRGTWVILPIIYILYIILLQDVYSAMEVLFYSGLAGILTIATIPYFDKYVSIQSARGIWKVTIGGFVLAVCASFVIGFLVEYLKKFSQKKIMITGSVCITLIIIIGVSMIGIALRTEKPVELFHQADEKNETKQVYRTINGIDADTTYTFKYDAECDMGNEGRWAYRVIVESINNQQNIVSIFDSINTDLQNQNGFDFKSLEDTEKINIKFYNYYAGTGVKLENAKLINQKDGRQIRVIFQYKYIPDMIISKLNDINLKSDSVTDRVLFYKDAMKMIKDRPVFGAGGGGWAALYFMYQSYMYWSTQTHNYFMQVWIEAGTIGLIALLAFITLFLYTIYRFKKERADSKEDNILIVTMVTSVISLLAHSAIDFDLSLAAISLVLWELIAFCVVIANDSKEHNMKLGRHYFYEITVMFIVTVIALIVTINLNKGYACGLEAAKSVEGKSYKRAIYYFEKAIKYDPFAASYHMDLAKLYNDLSVSNKNGKKEITNREQYEKAPKLVDKALKLEPYNSRLYTHASSIVATRGMIEEAMQYIEKSIKVQPLRSLNYQQKTDLYMQIAMLYLNNQQYGEAESILKEVLSIPETVMDLNRKILKPISLTDATIEHIEICSYLLKYYRDIEKVVKFSNLVYNPYFQVDVNSDNLPDSWQLWSPEGSEIKTEITANGSLKIMNYGTQTGGVFSRKFGLEPNKKYTLELRLKGKQKSPANLNIYVLSYTGQHVQMHATVNEVMEEETNLRYDFITSKDFEPTNQCIRIDLPGETVDYVEILEILLYSAE